MLTKLSNALRRMSKTTSTAGWSKDQWRSHLIDRAMSPSEVDEINAIFARAD